MDKEPLQLPKLFTWLRQRVEDPELRSQLDALSKAYKARLRSGGVQIIHRGRESSPRELLNTYLNGKYFHNDVEKATLIDELEAGDLVPRVVVMEAAVVVAKTSLRMADIVKKAKRS
jgi:hypothetical protein